MMKRNIAVWFFVLLTVVLLHGTTAWAQHPGPQLRPGLSTQTASEDGTTTFVQSPEGLLPIGENKLDYVESNIFDMFGNEMVNTLPSRPDDPFNLHDGPVQISDLEESASPADDLEFVLRGVRRAADHWDFVDQDLIQFGLDILEGNTIPGKAYSGISMLHYTGPEKIKLVTPILDNTGTIVGGNVNVHQIWFDGSIESDTAFLDPSYVQDVPWTVTYTVDVLTGGADDFAPFVMYFDAKVSGMRPPHVAMDSSFFPMSQRKRYVIKVKHAQGEYFNLIYTWGWRIHPPRVQVMENVLKKAGPMTLDQWEISTFGESPRSNQETRDNAISRIGELSPAKRIWQALRDAPGAAPEDVVVLMNDALLSFEDWSDRRSLPRGVEADPDADLTLFYENNTLYGNARTFGNWKGRGSVFKVTLLNGDHFIHGYMNVDFGGSRGWENQYQTAGGPASSHTFGRVHWWVTAGGPNGPIVVPPVEEDGTPELHKVEIELNFDSPERLSLYQFDPFHHDVAVYSLH